MNASKNKNNNNNSSITLDNKHKELLDSFFTNEAKTIPELNEKRKKLKHSLKFLKKIEKKLDLNDEIRNIDAKIKELKVNKRKYLLDNSKLIFDYFEEKQNIGKIDKEKQSKNTLVNKFFGIQVDPHQETSSTHRAEESTILNKYLNNVDDNYFDLTHFVKDTDVCKKCFSGELVPIEDEGQMVCNHCFYSIQYLIEHDKPCYKEPPKEVCFYAYKRINHFKEIISQFQGKETTQIPPEVLIKIKGQIKKERIETSQITNQKTKEILKKLGYNKYYEHIPFIKEKLGIVPPIMTPELEETLCNLFTELQAPYAKYCPDDRVNFLNYYYTAFKLCELLGETQYIDHFPMLKDREKRLEQDDIWKHICRHLNWEFIPTIN